jgi:hypothetical protein
VQIPRTWLEHYVATSGMAEVLQLEGILLEPVQKIHEGRPNSRECWRTFRSRSWW